MVASSEPIDSTAVRIRRCCVSSMTMPKCSTGRAPYSGSRYAASAGGDVQPRALAGRRSPACGGRARRPRVICAARARDRCRGTRRRSLRGRARARPRSPPTASSTSLASDSTSACREPWPRTMASSSLSPRPRGRGGPVSRGAGPAEACSSRRRPVQEPEPRETGAGRAGLVLDRARIAYPRAARRWRFGHAVTTRRSRRFRGTGRQRSGARLGPRRAGRQTLSRDAAPV